MSCCFPKVKAFPDLTVISLQDLKSFGHIPPHAKAKAKLVNINSVNMQDSLMVFVSHAWLQDAFPDNDNNEKYTLTVEGISKLKDEMAPKLSNCYIWMDYICFNGKEKKKADFSSMFFNTIFYCDCMFTPIVDHLADHWQLEHTPLGYFVDYKASAWNGGKDSSDKKCYLNRAWCRTEAFYCSNLPLPNSETALSGEKIAKYDGILSRLASYGNRPHFLYGHREQALQRSPLNLPQLQNTYFADYHPMKGQLSDEGDNEIIKALVQELEGKYAKQFEMGYVGDFDDKGHYNGIGRYLSAKYDVYTGFFLNNKHHNHGVCYSPNGDRFEGNWDNNHKVGEGTMHYINGNVYSGGWSADMYEGEGKMTYAEGPHLQYDGTWSGGKRNGHGKCTYRKGESILDIEGNWSKNHSKGKATINYADGSVYDGETKDAVKHGKGQLVSSLGKFKGDFRHDKYHGRGHMDFKNGDVFNGEWSEGIMHGRGSLVREGEEYDGYFKQGLKCGQGKLVYKDKTVYVGEWLDDKRHGKGKMISADETEVKEATWVDDEMVQ